MEVQKINKNIANIIASGSTGNCEIYFNSIAIDMGISYKQIEPYKNDLQLVCISHKHSDHFNINTLSRLFFERPSLRLGCTENMKTILMQNSFIALKRVDVYELNKWYDYGTFKISIGQLFHDVENVFFRLDKNGYKIFRATDTAHLNGIEAKHYDLYCIESNYNEETIHDRIEAKEAKGEFAYQKGAINSHLSEQQAKEFIFKNRKPESKVIRLHESKSV